MGMLLLWLFALLVGLWLGIAIAIYSVGRVFVLNWDWGFALCWPLWLVVAVADRT